MSVAKCECGCGQAPASTTRLRKASCSCGASIIRLSRSALALVSASCSACGGELSPDCLFDRTCSHDESDALEAVRLLENTSLDSAERSARFANRRLRQMRCGNPSCRVLRSFGAGCDPTVVEPCPKCGSELPATFGARRVVEAMPF